jgi:NAD-dependent epimerase/dehydratase
VDAVILVHGDDSRPEGVDYGVVPALLGALNGRRPHVALMSSINATDASGPYADLLTWKRRGERLLRASGLAYTIVRPGWFDAVEFADDRPVLAQGDTARMGGVRREHVAQTLVEAVLTPSASGRTVEVFSGPGSPVSDWDALFAATQADAPGSLDGALDPPNLPLDGEPARVVADLERFGKRPPR